MGKTLGIKQGICVNCKRVFVKYRKNQTYCSAKPCQRARKNKWQRKALRINPEYRARQEQADLDWHEKTPDYWQTYRKKTPEKTERNKILQRIRNQKRRFQTSEAEALKAMFNRINIRETSRLIAKMDVSKTSNRELFNEFWMVPLIAKMDAIKVNISMISVHSKKDSG